MAKETVASLTRRVNSFQDPFQVRYFVGCNLEFIHENFAEMCHVLRAKILVLRSSWAKHDSFYNKMLDGLLEDIEALEISPGVRPKPSSFITSKPSKIKNKPVVKKRPVKNVHPANPLGKTLPLYKKPKYEVIVEETFNAVKPSQYLSIEVKKFNANLIEEARRELVRIALRSTNNDMKQAAKALGITPRTLEFWVKDMKEEDNREL
jgi:hypothetical protein